MLYCVKCRKKTENSGKPTKTTSKNGRAMQVANCAVCGTKKTQFVKK